ncbi:MAG TPA: type I 3-dehydroquinate dehydratase, partial [Phycisphaerae bacterium]|nr:type I 3-dehydroquinate dehydratase [Phycisphaerae bacterium]
MCSSTHIVVPIVSAAVPLADQVRAAQAAGADVVELRVDRIGDVAAVEALLAQSRSVPLIITVRSAAEGGAWTGGEDE